VIGSLITAADNALPRLTMIKNLFGLRRLGLAAFAFFTLSLGSVAAAEDAPIPAYDGAKHMGVASCAGSTCHSGGASTDVLMTEVSLWEDQEFHARSFQVLFNDRSKRIARNLGIGPAHEAPMCLTCHTHYVPEEQRGEKFQISDGVGCEACHGGSGGKDGSAGWLASHYAADATHQKNLSAGLFPTTDVVKNAEMCLSCHLGTLEGDKKFVTHRIMGAGHPRMGFELDNWIVFQQHHRVDADYRERKPVSTAVQTWAVGQAVTLRVMMEGLMDPQRSTSGAFPELTFFSCHACHESMDRLTYAPNPVRRPLAPGIPPINDANIIMLRALAEHVDPQLYADLKTRSDALHRSVMTGQGALRAEAKAMHAMAERMIARFRDHEFDVATLKAVALELCKNGLSNVYTDYSGAEQAFFALQSLAAAMNETGQVEAAKLERIDALLQSAQKKLDDDDAYGPGTFVASMRQLKAAFDAI